MYKIKKASIEDSSRGSDRVLAESYTEGMPEADAEAPCYALRKFKQGSFHTVKHLNFPTRKKAPCPMTDKVLGNKVIGL